MGMVPSVSVELKNQVILGFRHFRHALASEHVRRCRIHPLRLDVGSRKKLLVFGGTSGSHERWGISLCDRSSVSSETDSVWIF